MKAPEFIQKVWLVVTRARFRRAGILTVKLLQAETVRAQDGSFQIVAQIQGMRFSILMYRDVLVALTPQLNKATNEERFLECKAELREVIRRKARDGEFGIGNSMSIINSDL